MTSPLDIQYQSHLRSIPSAEVPRTRKISKNVSRCTSPMSSWIAASLATHDDTGNMTRFSRIYTSNKKEKHFAQHSELLYPKSTESWFPFVCQTRVTRPLVQVGGRIPLQQNDRKICMQPLSRSVFILATTLQTPAGRRTDSLIDELSYWYFTQTDDSRFVEGSPNKKFWRVRLIVLYIRQYLTRFYQLFRHRQLGLSV